MKQIGANVFVEDRHSSHPNFRGANIGFVTTAEGIVVIDTPYMPKDALALRDTLARKGKVLYVVNTHHHLDHITGNAFLPGTVVSHAGVKEMFTAPINQVIGSERAEEAARASLSVVDFIRLRVRELDPQGLPLPDDYRLRAPSITFSDRLTLHVGQHTFELMHLPGHTASHIGVYVPEEKIFFAGDNFNNAVQPTLAQSLPLEWIESLRMIEALDANVIVPGHGLVCGKKEIAEFRLFLQQCIDRVREFIRKGKSREEALRDISFGDFLPAVHPGDEMQRMNVSRLYEMLSVQ